MKRSKGIGHGLRLLVIAMAMMAILSSIVMFTGKEMAQNNVDKSNNRTTHINELIDKTK